MVKVICHLKSGSGIELLSWKSENGIDLVQL